MKGKRHSTEEKIRTLREVDGGKPIREVCQERNISEATLGNASVARKSQCNSAVKDFQGLLGIAGRVLRFETGDEVMGGESRFR